VRQWRAVGATGAAMERRQILIKYVEADRLWRLYWMETGELELADERWFPTIEAAGAAARELVFPRMEGTEP
jgi:hypothetical protein